MQARLYEPLCQLLPSEDLCLTCDGSGRIPRPPEGDLPWQRIYLQSLPCPECSRRRLAREAADATRRWLRYECPERRRKSWSPGESLKIEKGAKP